MVCHLSRKPFHENSCGNVSVANSSTPITLSLSHPESRTIHSAEEYSANSSTSAQYSSFGVHRAENGSLVNLLVYSFCQGGAREFGLVEGPITNILSLMIWVGYASQPNLHFQCTDGCSDDATACSLTSPSAACSSDPSWTLSSRIPIPCGTFRQLPKDMISSPRSWSAHRGEISRSSLCSGSLICSLAFGVDCVSK